MAAIYYQIDGPPAALLLGALTNAGVPDETQSFVTLLAPITVRYGPLGDDDTIPAAQLATDPTTRSAIFDRTKDIHLVLTQKGSGVLSLALEADYSAQTIPGTYAILARVQRDVISVWQQS